MGRLALIAWRNLLQHRQRTLMLGGAIAGVTALLVFLTCLSAGVGRTLFLSATTVSSGHINVGGFYKVTSGQTAPLVTDYARVRGIVEKALPDLDYIAARGRGFGRLVSDQGNVQAGIAGVEINEEKGLAKVMKMKEGSLSGLAVPGTVVLFETQARKLKVKTGDALVISVQTARGVVNTVDVRVAGVAEDMGLLSNFGVFVPQTTLRTLYQLNPDSTGALLVYVRDLSRVSADVEAVRGALKSAGYEVLEREGKPFWLKMNSQNGEDWTGQRLDVTSWEDEMSFISWTLKVVDGLAYALTGVLLTIIAVGIMNAMWIAIRERTREIGTLRAIGMGRGMVAAMFMSEAFLLAVFGVALGVAAGCAGAAGLDALHLPAPRGAQIFLMSPTFRFAFEPLRIAKDAVCIIACTTLIALITSIKAAGLKPVTAMSHVG